MCLTLINRVDQHFRMKTVNLCSMKFTSPPSILFLLFNEPLLHGGSSTMMSTSYVTYCNFTIPTEGNITREVI